MIHKYYARNKRIIFPWVKDWSSPHNEIRYSNNIKAMNYNKWFFFHPSAYKLIFYGFNCIGTLLFGLSALIFYFKDNVLGFLVCFLMGSYLAYNFFKKIRERKTIKDLTFFDLYMREFDDERTRSHI